MKQDLAPAERRLTAFDYVLYAALVLSWSASWYALSLQVGTVAVQTSLFWRFAIAATIMWAWVYIKREPMRFPLKLHLAFSGMGLFIFCLNFMLFYYGSVYLISGLLSVVFSLASVFNLALGFLIAKRIPQGRVLIGALIGISGIALMFWPELRVKAGLVMRLLDWRFVWWALCRFAQEVKYQPLYSSGKFQS